MSKRKQLFFQDYFPKPAVHGAGTDPSGCKYQVDYFPLSYLKLVCLSMYHKNYFFVKFSKFILHQAIKSCEDANMLLWKKHICIRFARPIQVLVLPNIYISFALFAVAPELARFLWSMISITLDSTTLTFNNLGFNNLGFNDPHLQQSLDSTTLGFNNLEFNNLGFNKP